MASHRLAKASTRIIHPISVKVKESSASPKSDNALDLYLNDSLFFSNIPRSVYDLTIGGYPVLKKWLSYREFKVLGRALHLDEITYFSQMARRLAALLSLSPALDSNYRSIASSISSAPPSSTSIAMARGSS